MKEIYVTNYLLAAILNVAKDNKLHNSKVQLKTNYFCQKVKISIL
jgi:hypothetical protein